MLSLGFCLSELAVELLVVAGKFNLLRLGEGIFRFSCGNHFTFLGVELLVKLLLVVDELLVDFRLLLREMAGPLLAEA